MFRLAYNKRGILKGVSFLSERKTFSVSGLTAEQTLILLGTDDRNLNALSEEFGCSVSFRDSVFVIDGLSEEDGSRVEEVLTALEEQVQRGIAVSEQDVIYAVRTVRRNRKIDFDLLGAKTVGRTASGKAILPRTHGQLEFVTALEEKTIVFAVGPAGTGKTFLAVTAAVAALKRGDVRRIVLTRPAVEAGENLGFLPGDLKEKVDPYLTPLYDALHEMLGMEQTEKLIEKGTIEIAPLAYMRGRTLNDAFVILDEAQNTTGSQMKMFLTRIGFHSRMVITGDVTQIDLPGKVESGLVQAAKVLEGLDDIAVLHFSADDVVRHPLVQKIVERYDRYANRG